MYIKFLVQKAQELIYLFQHRNYLFSSILTILLVNGDTVDTFVFGELLLSTEAVKNFTAKNYDVDNP